MELASYLSNNFFNLHYTIARLTNPIIKIYYFSTTMTPQQIYL